MSTVAIFRRIGQENPEFEVSLVYMLKPCFNKPIASCRGVSQHAGGRTWRTATNSRPAWSTNKK